MKLKENKFQINELIGEIDPEDNKSTFATATHIGIFEDQQHSGRIACLIELRNTNVASASWDKTIKIWDINTHTCKNTLNGHLEMVQSLTELKTGELVSASWDRTIKIWELKKFTCTHTLIGHSNMVLCLLQLNNEDLVSGSHDATIR